MSSGHWSTSLSSLPLPFLLSTSRPIKLLVVFYNCYIIWFLDAFTYAFSSNCNIVPPERFCINHPLGPQSRTSHRNIRGTPQSHKGPYADFCINPSVCRHCLKTMTSISHVFREI